MGEENVVGAFFAEGVGDEVLFEFAIGELFKPGDAEAMSLEGGDDVIFSIAVDVVDEHLRAAGVEVDRVEGPGFGIVEFFGLFVPAVVDEDIEATVAVDVTDAQAVGERSVVAVAGDGVEDPGFVCVGGIGGEVAERAIDGGDQAGGAIFEQVDQEGAFIIKVVVDNRMFDPMRIGVVIFRVFVPPGVSGGKADDEDIGGAVVVEVAGVHQEGVGIFVCGVPMMDGHEFVAFSEVRAFVPVRARGDVGMAVVVEVSERGAFAEEGVGQANFLKLRFGCVGRGGKQKSCDARECQAKGKSAHGWVLC